MKDEQVRVLKTFNEATSRMDLNAFAEKVNLTANQTIHQIQELAKEGFLQRVGAGYSITQKGKTALKAFASVAKEQDFHFYFGLDQPSEFKADSLEQFYCAIKQIGVGSLEFHLYRGDFQNWLRDVFKEPDVTDEFERVKASELKGEDLRAEILKILNEKYGIEELL